jgi:hypothetical protein
MFTGLRTKVKGAFNADCSFKRVCREVCWRPRYFLVSIFPNDSFLDRVNEIKSFSCQICHNRENINGYIGGRQGLGALDVDDICAQQDDLRDIISLKVSLLPVLIRPKPIKESEVKKRKTSKKSIRSREPLTIDYEMGYDGRTKTLDTCVLQEAINRVGLALFRDGVDYQLWELDSFGKRRQFYYKYFYYFQVYVFEENLTQRPKFNYFYELHVDRKIFPLGLHCRRALTDLVPVYLGHFKNAQKISLYKVEKNGLEKVNLDKFQSMLRNGRIQTNAYSPKVAYAVQIGNTLISFKAGISEDEAVSKANNVLKNIQNPGQAFLLYQRQGKVFRKVPL